MAFMSKKGGYWYQFAIHLTRYTQEVQIHHEVLQRNAIMTDSISVSPESSPNTSRWRNAFTGDENDFRTEQGLWEKQ
jgi:hypothetical protein